MTFSHPKMTWYERQQRRKSSPFFRLLDRSFRFRLLLSAAIAFVLLAGVNRFENCHARNHSENCLSTNFWAIVTVGNVESFSIVTAAFLYILEGGRRKKQEHQEAMELILATNAAGAVNSLGRIDALENLNEDGIWLDGLNLEGSNLDQINLAHGRMQKVTLANASLKGANLSYINLIQANLSGADLTAVNLQGANLTLANLSRANLTDANLMGANLTDTDLTDAILTRIQPDRP